MNDKAGKGHSLQQKSTGRKSYFNGPRDASSEYDKERLGHAESNTDLEPSSGSTNIVVPAQALLEQPQRSESPLAKHLLGIQSTGMTDIDQIAANADNLIEILQTVKQLKRQKDEELRKSQELSAANAARNEVPSATKPSE